MNADIEKAFEKFDELIILIQQKRTVKMNADIEKAFEKFDECISHFGKGIENLFNDLTTEKKGSRIRIKKGSQVYVGKGVYAKLLNDVNAEVSNKAEKEEK